MQADSEEKHTRQMGERRHQNKQSKRNNWAKKGISGGKTGAGTKQPEKLDGKIQRQFHREHKEPKTINTEVSAQSEVPVRGDQLDT